MKNRDVFIPPVSEQLMSAVNVPVEFASMSLFCVTLQVQVGIALAVPQMSIAAKSSSISARAQVIVSGVACTIVSFCVVLCLDSMS